MSSNHLTVAPLAGACGAEVLGVDLSQHLDDGTIGDIRAALLDHGVIFFRDQTLDHEQHKRLARRFGEIFVHPNFKGLGADPEIVEIRRNPSDTAIVGEEWHCDTTMMAEPPMGAILYGVEVPPYGGDTQFASMCHAYDALSDGMKSLLAGMRAVHTDTMVAGPNANRNSRRTTKVREDADWKPTVNLHPVVRTHPETGRKSLFVNRAYVQTFEGMTEEESRPLLQFLFRHGERPEFTCRFRWRDGSIAFWDNRQTHHIAVNDAGPHFRHVRRVQIAGCRPV
jgi:taurine dioxygenase